MLVRMGGGTKKSLLRTLKHYRTDDRSSSAEPDEHKIELFVSLEVVPYSVVVLAGIRSVIAYSILRCGGTTFHPQLDQVQESAKSERFMVKEESAASVGTRSWTPEGRSLTLSFAFVL
ncbi:hypothetical protein AVEN_208709-1 [Araneus ventricosus]|uniref:Uncharacterized protein n=1 Tax=Araneus ventricosus TaxID=182803 RepID=A0A4Y2KFV6_ARAVE|nr:hypothetical protein AVEN_208709-1 [Araneus ventricosus]